MKLPTGAAGRMAAPRGNPKHAAKLVETPGDGLSDRSSILLTSTNLIAGRTPEVTIVVLPYGFVLATQIKDRL